MSTAARRARPPAGWATWAPYLLIAIAVWLAYQVLAALVVERAPAEIALRVAPGSPTALRKAAEGEYAAERFENAEELAGLALTSAPFDARALRVRALVQAQENAAAADQTMTLAGNWSLRDDPAHAWLMEHRLRTGDYVSSFGHADTLARRRVDLQPRLFNLFTAAAVQDPRSLPALAGLLRAFPPWRPNYLDSLHHRPDGAIVQANLAVLTQPTEGRFTDEELSRLYQAWVRQRRYEGLRVLRDRLQRPSMAATVQGGDFARDVGIAPFAWSYPSIAGLFAEPLETGDRPGDRALQVQTDNFSTGEIASQLLILAPGRYQLSGRVRPESAEPDNLIWVVRCAETRATLVEAAFTGRPGQWTPFRQSLQVPAVNCGAQSLTLEGRRGEARRTSVSWYDDIAVTAAP